MNRCGERYGEINGACYLWHSAEIADDGVNVGDSTSYIQYLHLTNQ